MATPQKPKVDARLSKLRAAGLEDADIRRLNKPELNALLDAEQAEKRQEFAPEMAKIEAAAAELLPRLTALFGPDEPTPQVRATLWGRTLADLKTEMPAFIGIPELFVRLAAPKTNKASGEGARAEMVWEHMVGLQPKWIAIQGRGKEQRLMKSGFVLYVEPPLESGVDGSVTWRTKELKSESRALSIVFSQPGRIRPDLAGVVTIQHAFGVLSEYAKAVSTKDKPVTEEQLLEVARKSDMAYTDLGDLGDPVAMSNSELEKAFANRVGLDLIKL